MAFRTQDTPIINEVIKRVNKNTHRIRSLEEINRVIDNKINFLEERTLKVQGEIKRKFTEITHRHPILIFTTKKTTRKSRVIM